MDNTILEQIKACEEDYLTLFCTKGREWGLFVYQDRQLPELPAHNFIRIPDHIPAGRLRGLADVARNTANATGRTYLRIEFPQPVNFHNARSEQWGYYVLSDLNAVTDVDPNGLITAILNDEETSNKVIDFELSGADDQDYALRCAKRLNDVFLAENGLQCCVCLSGDKIVATGQLFTKDGLARITDIKAVPGEDQNNVAAALLKYMVEQAQNLGAESIYVKSEKDICGFSKVGEGFAVMWDFV